MTAGQALVEYLVQQYIIIDEEKKNLFAGVFSIFGHGNVTCIGEALGRVQDILPTWRGQNEQGMALAAVGFAKANLRKQVMIVTSSIGPGATNIITACGVAMANRLPLLVISGDTFSSRLPDPVLQQTEHFHNPTITVNDSFKAVTRYWDRITKTEQLLHSLPKAVATLLDPVDCGPVFLGFCQDTQADAFDFPEVFFEKKIWQIPKQRPDIKSLKKAAEMIKNSKRPLIISGGGVRYSQANDYLRKIAHKYKIPVTETVAGKGSLLHSDTQFIGPIGTTGSHSANCVAKETDLVISIGCRLQDFTTASWSVFGNRDVKIVSINTARFDAYKHRASPVVGDALTSLQELEQYLSDWRVDSKWNKFAQEERKKWDLYIQSQKDKQPKNHDTTLTYAQVIGCINKLASDDDYIVAAAGGLPGELNTCWNTKSLNSFDCEYGFSCMGYEISGGWGASMANTPKNRDTIVFVGDGSYMMLNSDIYSSVLSGHKMILIICDNEGFAVIHRLQVNQGQEGFNNLYADCKIKDHWFPVDFVAHAKSMGAEAEYIRTLSDLELAFQRAKQSTKTYIISLKVQKHEWTESGAWWEVGVPEVSLRKEVQEARQKFKEGKKQQRKGV